MTPQTTISGGKILLPHPCPSAVAGLRSDNFHCSLCNKTLIDFRGKSLEEIKAILQEAPTGTCGIYSAADVEVPLQLPNPSKVGSRNRGAIHGKMRRFLFAFAAIFIPAFSVHGGNVLQSSEQNYSRDVFLPAFKNAGETILSGRVVAADGDGLEAVTVTALRHFQVIGTTLTDADGYFEINLPGKDYAEGELRLLFDKKDIGFGGTTITDPQATVCRKYTLHSLYHCNEEKLLKDEILQRIVAGNVSLPIINDKNGN